MWKDYVMEFEKNKPTASDREMIASLATIAKKHGVELKCTDYPEKRYVIKRRHGIWREWNPLKNDVDTYELLLACQVHWLDIRRPMKDLCEEIIMYRGEKNV